MTDTVKLLLTINPFCYRLNDVSLSRKIPSPAGGGRGNTVDFKKNFPAGHIEYAPKTDRGAYAGHYAGRSRAYAIRPCTLAAALGSRGVLRSPEI
jgi:hypothetical protein